MNNNDYETIARGNENLRNGMDGVIDEPISHSTENEKHSENSNESLKNNNEKILTACLDRTIVWPWEQGWLQESWALIKI